MFTQWLAKDSEYLQTIKDEGKVQIRELPNDVLIELKKHAEVVKKEVASKNTIAKEIYDSFTKFQKQYEAHQEVTERAYVRAQKIS